MQDKAKYWVSLAVSAAIAVLAYHVVAIPVLIMTVGLSVFMLLPFEKLLSLIVLQALPLYSVCLLVPLQFAFHRKGPREYVTIAAMAFGILLVLRGATALSVLRELSAPTGPTDVALAPLAGIQVPLVFWELTTVAALIGGQIWLNVYSPLYVKWRRLYRLLAATAVATGVGAITVVMLQNNRPFVEGTQTLQASMSAILEDWVAGMLGEVPADVQPVDPAVGLRMYLDFVLNGFMFAYFVNLAAACHIGNLMAGARRFGRRPLLANFRVPEYLVWFLIGSWALVGLIHPDIRGPRIASAMAQFKPIGLLGSAALSGGILLLLLFGLQGLSIIRSLLIRGDRLKDLRRFWFIGLAIVIFMRPVAVVALALIPLVGVSEIWIQYRVERRGEKNEGDS